MDDEVKCRPGRVITVPYRRQRVTVILGLLAPAMVAMGVFLVTIPETYSRYAMAHLAGYAAFPLALYMLLLAYRVATWPRMHLKLGRTKIEFPSLHGLFAKQIELDFDEIEDVGFVTSRGGTASVVWSQGKRYGIPTSSQWLPKGWSADDVTRRISLRWAAYKRGLPAPELAAVEAAWDDESVGGIAARRRGKKWKQLATVESEDDFERRQTRGRLDEDAECLLADEVMPDWRSFRDMLYVPK